MSNIKSFFRSLPGWLIWVIVLGSLYFSGWHTEVIGQVQRIILATGLIKPTVNPVNETTSGSPNPDNKTAALPLASYNFSLRTLNGEIVSMASLKGKVVFMNFWATWCPPCIAEMPNIQALYAKVQSDQIAFVMISLDKDPAKAQKFIHKKGFTFPVYQLNGALPSVYAGGVIPTTFVLSPEGRIVARKEGMADYNNQEFRDFLLKLAQTSIPTAQVKEKNYYNNRMREP